MSDTGSTPVEIRDPWVGPETYAQDYYSGGDLNRALEEELDPHLLGPEQTQRLSEEVGVFDVDSVSGIEVPPSTAPTDHFSDPEPAPRLFPFSATVTGEATRHDAPRDQPEEGEATKPYEAQAHEEIVEVSDASDDVSTGLSGAPEAEEQQERVYTPQADIVNVTQPEVPAPSPTFDGSVDPEVETASRPDDDILTIPGLGEPVSSSYEIEELDDDDFNLLYPDPTPQPSLGRITPEEDKPSLNNSEASSEVTARAPQPSDLATEDSRAQDIVPARKASPEIIMVEDSSDEEGDSEEFDQAQDEEMSGDVDRILVPEGQFLLLSSLHYLTSRAEVVEDQDVQTSVEVVDVESRKEEAIEEEDEGELFMFSGTQSLKNTPSAMIEARPEHKEDVMETGDVSEDAAGHNEVESEASSQGPVVEATPEVPEPVEQGPADLDSPSETAEEQSTLQEDTSHAEEEGQTIYTEHHKIEIEEVTDEDADEPLHPHPESDELPNESFAVDGNLSEPAKVVAAEELDVTETTCIVTEPVFEGMAMDDEDADGEMDDDFEVISVGSASSLQADNVGTVEEVDELEVQGLGETVKSVSPLEGFHLVSILKGLDRQWPAKRRQLRNQRPGRRLRKCRSSRSRSRHLKRLNFRLKNHMAFRNPWQVNVSFSQGKMSNLPLLSRRLLLHKRRTQSSMTPPRARSSPLHRWTLPSRRNQFQCQERTWLLHTGMTGWMNLQPPKRTKAKNSLRCFQPTRKSCALLKMPSQCTMQLQHKLKRRRSREFLKFNCHRLPKSSSKQLFRTRLPPTRPHKISAPSKWSRALLDHLKIIQLRCLNHNMMYPSWS